MWFNNAIIYSFESSDLSSLNDALGEHYLKPCPPHARFIYGWLPVDEDIWRHDVAGASLLHLGKEERILPRGVITRLLEERITELETQRGYPVKRSERAQLAEELEFELLPKAFCVQKKMSGLLDTQHNRLIINTSSPTQASQFIASLHKAVSGLHIEPVTYPENLAMLFTQWITNPNTLPKSLELASNCLLFSPQDEKKRFHCKGYELPADEIISLLSQGLATAEISLIWNERIQFTLTHDFIIKRLKCLDYLVDAFHDIRNSPEDSTAQNDAALLLLSSELRLLINDLLQ